MNYSKIFNKYKTTEGVTFNFISRKINFPEDESLPIYTKVYCDDDCPWTIASYKLYGSIDYWWVLCSLNKNMEFYAKGGETILIIKPEFLKEVLKYV